MKLAAERPLPRLVPKQRPTGIGAAGAAKHGKLQQRRLGNSPRPPFGAGLVEAEGGKGDKVHRDQRSDYVGGGDKCGERDHGSPFSWQRVENVLIFWHLPNPEGRSEDDYGRSLMLVTRGGESLGAVLVDEGLAEQWGGVRRAWC